MGGLLPLLRVQLLGLLNSLMPHGRRSSRLSDTVRVVALGLAALILGALIVVYLVIWSLSLASMGLAEVLPVLAALLGSLGGVLFTFMKANGTLFGARDYDLVMSLPVSRRCVVVSRLASLIGAAVALSVLIMTPIYVVYFIHGGADAVRIACAAVSCLLAPLAPTALAIFVAFGLAALSARFRHAQIAYVVLSLIAMLAIVLAAFLIPQASQDPSGSEALILLNGDAAALITGAVGSLYPPAVWAAAGATGGDPLLFGGFVLLSLAVAYACAEIMQRFYQQINEAVISRGGSGARVDLAKLRGSTPFRAILGKEFRCLVGIPSYAFNCLFGYAFMPGAAVVLSLTGVDAIFHGTIDASAAAEFGGILIPWIFGFCGSMCYSAVISISLEGRANWLMATLPVPQRTVLAAKLASNAIPVAVALAVSVVILLACAGVTPLVAFECALVGFGMFYLWVNAGMALDAARPNFRWVVPNDIVKRSAPALLCILGGMVSVFGLGALSLVLSITQGFEMAHALNVGAGALGIILGQLVFMRTVRRAQPFVEP